MLGKHGTGKIKAGMKIGPGKNNQKNPTPPKEKARKERKAKEKVSGAKMEKVMARVTLPTQLQKVQLLTSQPKPIAASTFFTMHNFSNLFEIEKKEEVPNDVPQLLTEQIFVATPETETSYLTHALTPTSMVLDLGCTRAMTSWRAAKDLMKFCDQNPACGLWYRLDQTTSQFTFAISESASCKQKIVVCVCDVDYVAQSTEFDIAEQGEVPTLMSSPEMRNNSTYTLTRPTSAVRR